MGKLNIKQVLHIAKLANLKLTSKEVEKFRKELSEILNYIDILNAVDTKDVQPTSRVTELGNVFRKDKVDKKRYLSQKEALSGTKHAERGFFKTKLVMSKQ
jgi:aspartyl-tRNA(Asn)/glutamyl-tRNA(Gln) amidotransferase subunit C